MHKLLRLLLFVIITTNVHSQSQLPHQTFFKDISHYPELISEETILARMIDALGFRFYWATDSLRQEDLTFKPSKDAKTCAETISHILDLSTLIHASVKGVKRDEVAISPVPSDDESKRILVLNHLYQARQQLSAEKGSITQVKIILPRSAGDLNLPVWNLINGPIADAIWHSGQIATMRRMSGNNINPKVNHMMGKLR